MTPSPDHSHEPLLKTKLSAPQLRASLVSRPRLLNLLSAGASRALTLISAPAGYGKTTLLVEWISRHHQAASRGKAAVAWLSLDEGDNEATPFLSYIFAALQNADPKAASQVGALLGTFPMPPVQTILSVLINELADLAGPIILALDDYQFITNPAIHTGVAFLLDRLPPSLHLVIATRSDPPLPLARLRARDQLIEVRAEQMRFTPDETADFLRQVMELPLSAEDLSTLETRTEGWPAGLQMAALSMQGREDLYEFIKTFSGSHRYVMDYLAEEVLNRQDQDVQKFLILTSVLDRFCASLCSDVTGQEEAFSRKVLEYLDHTNLFLIALDEERLWYRYHHLFADLLKARLLQAQPDLVPRLHLRASEWFEKGAFTSESVQHAFSGGDDERAAGLIERYGPTRWLAGDTSLLRLAGRLPPETIRRHPKLGLYQGWMLIAEGQLKAAIRLLDELKKSLSTGSVRLEFSWIPAFIELLSVYAAHQAGDQAQAAVSTPLPDYAALDHIPAQDLPLRSAADYIYAILLNRRGEFELAGEILQHCIRRDLAAGGSVAVALVGPLLARIRMMQGRLPETAALCREYLGLLAERGKKATVSAGGLDIMLGEVLYEWNDLEGAERHVREGIRANEPWENILIAAIGTSDLVSILEAKGDLGGAEEAMNRVDAMFQGRTETLDLEEELATIRARLWLAQGDLARAGEWADRVSQTEPLDYLQDWGRVTLARVRIAQGRPAEAVRILEELAHLPGAVRRVYRQIRVQLLLSIAHFARGSTEQALQALEACLSLAEQGGYIRVFLDSGEPVRRLLSAYLHSPAPVHSAYAQKLLEAFPRLDPGPASKTPLGDWVEPMTARELEVLRLMAEGLSNRQIAEKLFLAEGTVKFHVHSILDKLQVHSRTQAIVKAKEGKLV